jgi:hypothetical protein
MTNPETQGILFAGLAKNVRKSIPYVLENLDAYGSLFREHKVYVVENASSDGTKEYLYKWANEKQCRIHIDADEVVKRNCQPSWALGTRLAFLRNMYMDRIEQEDNLRYPFVVIADCDNVNELPIERDSILAAVRYLSQKPDRAAVFANQRGFYYDISALRHEHWCPGDCWQDVNAWSNIGFVSEAVWGCVGSRQIHIPADVKPIEVNSAFGGLGIYKTSFLKGLQYCGTECEHVSLHRDIVSKGGRLFIFPSLRNGTQFEHVARPRDLYYWRRRLGEMADRQRRRLLRAASRHGWPCGKAKSL